DYPLPTADFENYLIHMRNGIFLSSRENTLQGIMLDATSLINNVFVLVLQREGFRFDHGVRWIPALQMLASVPCSAQWVRVANADQFRVKDG
ncbi:MAG: hypothetical protein MJA30_34905, partial [Cytophagales bacterium]|nr:hypothetical protein [Cytophagales bacterium]